ncbi:hypothetical protein LP420_06930 [Massilia sp. B-10]|nr:hypothetical protein LP420_06930 [Massilia sp. B-10]
MSRPRLIAAWPKDWLSCALARQDLLGRARVEAARGHQDRAQHALCRTGGRCAATGLGCLRHGMGYRWWSCCSRQK